MTIHITNADLSWRCYNLPDAEKAIQRSRSGRSAARKPATTDDAAAILAIGQARGYEELAKAFTANKMGDLKAFKDMLAARYNRIHRLFPNGVVR